LKNWRRNLFGIAISCACLGFIAWRINLDDVLQSISLFRWPYLFWGLLSLSGGYTLRIVRWSTILRAAGADISSVACISPYLGSIALNNVLPMRLGDVVRALVFPSAIGVGKATATGSLVMERLLDLMTLLTCLVIGLAISSKVQLLDWLASAAVSLALLGGFALALVFFFSGILSRWCSRLIDGAWVNGHDRRIRIIMALTNLLGSFEAMSRLPVLISLFVLSMLIWVGEAGLFWALLHGFGLEAGLETAVVVMAIATLSTMVPSSPGYIGPFHLAAYMAISMLGGTPGQAASFAVLSHLGLWLPTTLAGAVAILVNPQLFSRVISGTATSR
jgi:glycosyltransferase 2 family protein